MLQRSVIAALFGISLAACSGPSPVTGYVCPASVESAGRNAQAIAVGIGALVSPADGATNVPTTVGTVTFTVTDPSLRSGTLTLFVATNLGRLGAVQGGPIVTDSNGVSSSAVPALQPHTTYRASVAQQSNPASVCSSGYSATLGSFTTQ